MQLLQKLRKVVIEEVEELRQRSGRAAKPIAGDAGAGVDIEGMTQMLTDASRALDESNQRTAELTRERDFYKKRSEEYFGLIERIERQREEWHLLWRRDSSGHQGAQALLQEALMLTRQQLLRAAHIINALRKEKGDPEVSLDALDVKAPPIGVAEQTAQQNAAAESEVSPTIDSKAEVEKIREAAPAPMGVVDYAVRSDKEA